MKNVILILLFVVIGLLFGGALGSVFGVFNSGFVNLTTLSADIISFFVNCVSLILNKPFIMSFIGVLLVFVVIGVIIDFFKGGK